MLLMELRIAAMKIEARRYAAGQSEAIAAFEALAVAMEIESRRAITKENALRRLQASLDYLMLWAVKSAEGEPVDADIAAAFQIATQALASLTDAHRD